MKVEGAVLLAKQWKAGELQEQEGRTEPIIGSRGRPNLVVETPGSSASASPSTEDNAPERVFQA